MIQQERIVFTCFPYRHTWRRSIHTGWISIHHIMWSVRCRCDRSGSSKYWQLTITSDHRISIDNLSYAMGVKLCCRSNSVTNGCISQYNLMESHWLRYYQHRQLTIVNAHRIPTDLLLCAMECELWLLCQSPSVTSWEEANVSVNTVL